MLTNEEFLQHLHDALNHLYEPDRLRRNPLGALLDVANRVDTYSALQTILIEAIESLEPQPEEPADSPSWLIYEPLSHRYVQQRSQDQVARQLGISVRHLRRKEHAAVEVLASRLWSQFGLEARLRQEEEKKAISATDGSPSVTEELAWLRDTPPEAPVDVSQVLPEVLALAEPLALQHDVDLDISTDDGLPKLAAHSLALSQALLNLLSIAIHRASGHRVLMSVLADPRPPAVAIQLRATNGPGRRGRASDDDAVSLALAHQLAELCGGRLEVSTSNRVFKATLRIPALGQLPVLVIDDNADTLQLLQRYTVDTRFRLITSPAPEQALTLVDKYAPAIIVLDVMMPHLDGWKVLSQLRQHPTTAGIPILVCTILAQEELALSHGASGFIRKPITRQAFLHALGQQIDLMERECR